MTSKEKKGVVCVTTAYTVYSPLNDPHGLERASKSVGAFLQEESLYKFLLSTVYL